MLYRPDTPVSIHDLGPFAVIATDLDILARLNRMETLDCRAQPAEQGANTGCPRNQGLGRTEAASGQASLCNKRLSGPGLGRCQPEPPEAI